MDDDQLARLAASLERPGAVPDADGLAVEVLRVVRVRGGRRPELRVTYRFRDVPGLPPGVAGYPEPGDGGEVGDELVRAVADQVWQVAIGHHRRFRPPPEPDPDVVAAELPPVGELWDLLRRDFAAVEGDDVPGGFRGRWLDQDVEVLVTPEQWAAHVLLHELAARRDYGIDASGPGDGPAEASWRLMEQLDDVAALVTHLVWTGHGFLPWYRPDPPPWRLGLAAGPATDEELWEHLVVELGRGRPVERLGPGRLRADTQTFLGQPVTRTLVADQATWATYVRAGRVSTYGLDDLLSDADDDEVFWILTDDGFVSSVREALPRVPGTATQRRRASAGTRSGWYPAAEPSGRAIGVSDEGGGPPRAPGRRP